ncbi:MAG: acyl carrier protein [Pirellulales bacterium]|nr:acyl carrier protein [Pirellulales bacterium]
MPLTAAQKTQIREIIARNAKVDVSELAPEAGIFTDLGMDPMDAGFMLADLSIKLGIDFRPILNEVDEAFKVTKRGSLTKTSRGKIEYLLPGIPIPTSKMQSSDELWSVAMLETLFEQQLLRIEQAVDFEPISSKSQQAWKNQLPQELGERRLRLLLAAAVRHSFAEEHRITPTVNEAFDLLHRYADTGESKKQLRDFRRAYRSDWYQGGGFLRRTWEYRGFHPYRSLYDALDPNKPEEAVESVANAFECVFKLKGGEAVKLLRRFYNDLVSPLGEKDKFDNAWRTPAVIQLATAMYESRDFSKMTQLATALKKAGCTNEAILDHCRDTQVFHNRGCWVVDAILDGNWPGTERPEEPIEKTLLATLPKKVRLSIEELLQKKDAGLTIEQRLAMLWDFSESSKRRGWTQEQVNAEIKRWGEMCPAWTEKQARTAVTLHNVCDGNWAELGIARRFALEQPSELAIGYGIMLRSMWINNALMNAIYGGCGDTMSPRFIYKSLAVRDVTLAQRVAEITPEIETVRRDDPIAGVCLAMFRRDFDLLRSLARGLGRAHLRSDIEWMATCVKGIAKESPRLVAEHLQERIDATRKSRSYASNAVDLDAHGFYHLCQWAAPELVSEFDVKQALPWDAQLHSWLQDHEDPVSNLDLKSISPELHRAIVLLDLSTGCPATQ